MKNDVLNATENYFLVHNGIARSKIYILPTADSAVFFAAKQLADTVEHITGVKLEIIKTDFRRAQEGGVFLCTVKEYPALEGWFERECAFVKEKDGFSVRRKGNDCYIFAEKSAGVFYGACDVLEKSAQVVWSRGKAGEEEIVIRSDCVSLFCDYSERASFEIRGWHACGRGENGDKLSPSTMRTFGRNKVNSKLELFEEEYKNYGIFPFGVLPYNGLLYFDDLMESNPEYFMLGADGKPMPHNDHDSFLNYYRKDVAEMCAQKYLDMLKEYPAYANYILKIKAPDDPRFYMVDEDGSLLHEKPFVADDGTTVYPEEAEYQATVYWNFINRLVKIVAKAYPDIQFFKVAYQYAELCPKIELDEHIIVGVAPIKLDGHYSYVNPKCSDYGKSVLENIENWCKKCKKVTIYEYWQCTRCQTYSRPNIYVVQENVKKYLEVGVWGLTPEGKVDKSVAQGDDFYYDLNEMYYWITNKLMWNVDFDIAKGKERFCDIVYGNASKDMQEYFSLIEKGWKEQDGYVGFATSSELYTKEFIINAGIADGVKNALTNALSRELNDVQRRKITVIKDIVFKEIEKYANYQPEDAIFEYTDAGVEKILSDETLDYKHNKESVWNRAGEIKVFKNYLTMEDLDKAARFSVKLLFDDDYIYFGYTLHDDMLCGGEDGLSEYGKPIFTRTDGSVVVGTAEVYIGGNNNNMAKYYGYITGVRGKANERYINDGLPNPIEMGKDFKEAFFKHVGDNPEDRYYFHVQAIPFKDLLISCKDAAPYGSLVYYSNRFGRVGWKGNGLWCKQSFSNFTLKNKGRSLCNRTE